LKTWVVADCIYPEKASSTNPHDYLLYLVLFRGSFWFSVAPPNVHAKSLPIKQHQLENVCDGTMPWRPYVYQLKANGLIAFANSDK